MVPGESPMVNWWECYLEDGGSEITAVEAGNEQALHVRVGPVYHGNEQDPTPGVWIEYQEKYMAAPLAGPVLLTPKVWRQLNKAVEARFRGVGRCEPLWKRWLRGVTRSL